MAPILKTAHWRRATSRIEHFKFPPRQVGHRCTTMEVDLCLYYSIKKKVASIKKYIFNQKNPFQSKKKSV